jgi:hypothetical protein
MLILIAALVMTILVSIAKIKLDKDLEKIK